MVTQIVSIRKFIASCRRQISWIFVGSRVLYSTIYSSHFSTIPTHGTFSDALLPSVMRHADEFAMLCILADAFAILGMLADAFVILD